MSTTADIRINARLTGEDAERFRELLAGQELSASDLLRVALREYHERHAAVATDALAILGRHGFVAGGEGPEDLSSNYKYYLADALEDKLPPYVQQGLAPYNVTRKP